MRSANWRVILWALRVPIPPYRGVPLPPGQRCPLIGRGCGTLCRYDLTPRKGIVDGRCLTRQQSSP